MKRALITGINGMDGSYLAELLLEKDYEVFGMERRSSSKNRTNTGHLEGKITFVNGDLTDQNSLMRCLKESNPDEVYNLAAQSFVGESWNTPEQTGDVTGLGVLRMLEAIREYGKEVKFYQALPPHERDMRSKGIPMMGSGLVFPIDEDSLTCEPFIIPSHYPRIAGLDFGYDHPTAVVWVAWDRDKDIVYIHDPCFN